MHIYKDILINSDIYKELNAKFIGLEIEVIKSFNYKSRDESEKGVSASLPNIHLHLFRSHPFGKEKNKFDAHQSGKVRYFSCFKLLILRERNFRFTILIYFHS